MTLNKTEDDAPLLMGHIDDHDTLREEEELNSAYGDDHNWKQIWIMACGFAGTLRYTYSLEGKYIQMTNFLDSEAARFPQSFKGLVSIVIVDGIHDF